MGGRGRGDHERPGRRGGEPERGQNRPGDGRQDEKFGYKDRVHEGLDRMDQHLERHLKGGEG